MILSAYVAIGRIVVQCLTRVAPTSSASACCRRRRKLRQNLVLGDFGTLLAGLHAFRQCILDFRFFQVFLTDLSGGFLAVPGANRRLSRV